MIRTNTMFDTGLFSSWKCGAAVFDLDDTLYPEQQFMLSGFRAVSRYVNVVYGIDIYDDLVALHMSGERANIFAAALRLHFKKVDNLTARNVAHVFWAHAPRIDLFTDARAALSFLRGKNIRIALLTTGSSALQRRKVAALGLEHLLDATVHNDDLLGPREPGRPVRDAFFVISAQLDVEIGQMIYIGDNPLTDFTVPRALGIPTVRIARKNGEHAAALPPAPADAPDVVIGSLDGLISLPAQKIGASNDSEMFHDSTL